MRNPHLTIRTNHASEYAVSIFHTTVRGHAHVHHVAHSTEAFTHRTDSPQELPAVRGLDSAIALGLLILRAQRRDEHHERTCDGCERCNEAFPGVCR